MKKPIKILLGLVTLWPFVYSIVFFFFIFGSFFFISSQREMERGPQFFFFVIFPLHLLTMLLIMALTVFYIVNIFKNERVDKDKKILWAVVLFMGNMIAMPVYWYLYIWKEPDSAPIPLSLASSDTSAWVNNASRSKDQQGYVPPPEPPNWR